MKGKMIPVFLGAFALIDQAAAQTSFGQTKTFVFKGGNPGALPALEGSRFGHVFYEFDKGTSGAADVTRPQANGFNVFGEDFFSRGNDGVPRLMNRGKPGLNVDVILERIRELQNLGLIDKKTPLKLEKEFSAETPNGTARSSVATEIKTRKANEASGGIRVQGGHSKPAKGESAMAFAYGHVVATNRGVTAGEIKVGDTKANVSIPIICGQERRNGRTGAFDPAILRVINESGQIVFEHVLYTSYSEVTDGTLDWIGGRLNIDAKEASLHIQARPLDSRDPGGTLSIVISNGVVTLVGRSGEAFNSCVLPSLGESGRVNCSLPNEFTFRYDLSQYARTGQQLSTSGEFLGFGFAESLELRAVEEPFPEL